MYTVQQAIENTISELLSWDAENITTKMIIDRLNEYIENLYSYIDRESHKRLEDLGVEDNTKMSWIDQDAQTIEQINDYKEAVKYLESLPINYDWSALEMELVNNPLTW